ncbi:hypothetical protein NQ315_010179 [Exocentrus adspersus]|uniref:Golgin-84 n=1 Tax=Exocentrus adspersus TaxID=1586481 RepID=A0AAV8WC68_9CUCU|nr:hypothetical protein NQ315_010179 [Exocentrus adspersus]
MAWLQNLAGRAEDLLNKIDQNAATVLNESNSRLLDIESDTQNMSKELVQEKDVESDSITSGPSIVNMTRNSSFQNSPVKENKTVEETINMEQSDTSIIFDVMSEKQKSSSGSINDDSIIDKSFRSSAKSDQLSTSSSFNNSFLLAEESSILHEKVAKLEFENQDLNKQLINMQHMYSELRNENANLQFQIERCNEQVAQAQVEKDQYIARAQRILQEKEKLISLKQENTFSETSNLFETYNEELKKELEFHQAKNEELTQKNNQLVKDLQSLQMQHRIIQNGLHQSLQNLEQNILNEKTFRANAEEECSLKTKELYLKNQELLQLKEQMGVKDNEIAQLKEIIKQKANVNVNEDVESRIKSLTQTLMLKQNKVETVTTERNALRLQIEKLENEYKRNLAQLHRAQKQLRCLDFFRVSPFDAGVTRRVKHAYSTLDAISIRTGIFLRRYPVARVFVFCYMVLLHIWVLIILFWYAPTNR